jgi:hypothetical protein
MAGAANPNIFWRYGAFAHFSKFFNMNGFKRQLTSNQIEAICGTCAASHKIAATWYPYASPAVTIMSINLERHALTCATH